MSSSSADSDSSEEIDIEALRNAPVFLSESSDDSSEKSTAQDKQNGDTNASPEAMPIPVLNRPGPPESPELNKTNESAEEGSEDGVTLYLTPLNPDGSYNYDDDIYTPPTSPPRTGFRDHTTRRSVLEDREFSRSIRATLPPFPDPSGIDFNIFRNATVDGVAPNLRPRIPALSPINFPTPRNTPRSEGVTLMLTPLNPDGTPRASSDDDNNTPPQTNVRDSPRSPTPESSAPRGPGLLRAREFVRSTRANVLRSTRLSSVPGRGYYNIRHPRALMHNSQRGRPSGPRMRGGTQFRRLNNFNNNSE